MTDGLVPELPLPPSQIEDLLKTLVKGVRASQIYLPNNPIYQRAVGNLRSAFQPIWESVPELTFSMTESDFTWEQQVVYRNPTRTESIAWLLFKDGLRSLTFKPGVEEEEIVRLIELLHQVKNLPSEADDDLLTLLWAQDFQLITYRFVELLADAQSPEAGSHGPTASMDQLREAVKEEVAGAQAGPPGEGGLVAEQAAQARAGVVNIDDFDSTLYFLEENEINYIARAVEAEYQVDLRTNTLAILFDIFELQADPGVRSEGLAILTNFVPYLLASGDFRSVAFILRELRTAAKRLTDLDHTHKRLVQEFPTRLSEPEVLSQLLQAIDGATMPPREEDLADLFQELRPLALGTLLQWMPRLASTFMRELVERAVSQLAEGNPSEVLRLLGSSMPEELIPVLNLVSRLKLQPAVSGLAHACAHEDHAIRLAAVRALASIASPGALTMLEKAVDDDDREVRLAAVRVLGPRGHRGGLKGIEAVVLGKSPHAKDMDLTEKMAFFEAYAMIAGVAGLETLQDLLKPGGLLKRGAPPETRACAAMALGKIRSPEARELLESAKADKDAVVRNAVSRALRESPA